MEFNFNQYHKIELTTEKNKIRKFNKEKIYLNYPHSKKGVMWVVRYLYNNKGGVLNNSYVKNDLIIYKEDKLRKYKDNKNYIIEKYNFCYTKYQILLDHNEILVSANSIKIRLINIPDNNIFKYFKKIIKYLIDNEYIKAISSKNHILYYYIKKFRLHEIELNHYYKNQDIFNTLQNYYCSSPDVYWKLRNYNTTTYLWCNKSSDLYCYNVTAKLLYRDYHSENDLYKIELRIHNNYLKEHPEINLHNFLNIIQNKQLMKKAKRYLEYPFMLQNISNRILDKLNCNIA